MSTYKEALNGYAIERAKRLGCNLYTVNVMSNLAETQTRLESFINYLIPFEYVNALEGIKENGEFVIEHARQVLV